MITQFGVLVCQSTISLLKAVQKRSKKLKIKNQNIKFRWWNSWAALFLKLNGANSSFKSTSTFKNQKFPHLREMVQTVSATFASRNPQIYHKKPPIIKSITLYTGKTKTRISILIPLVPIIWNSTRMYNISQIIWCVTKHSVHYLSNIDSNQWGAGSGRKNVFNYVWSQLENNQRTLIHS